MALFLTTYRERELVVDDASAIKWINSEYQIEKQSVKISSRVIAIHEGSAMPYGEKVAVFHVSRTDVDPDEDVPTLGLPSDENIVSKSWKSGNKGRKVYSVFGRCWKNEWIDAGQVSFRVLGNEMPGTVFFIVDAAGNIEAKETLRKQGRWLWFNPEVVMALLAKRGSSINWYTRYTGSVGCSPANKVHFGINKNGLVNVYAKDIAMLPDWQQKIWAGHNISPDGGISGELYAAQIQAQPASTYAPEAFLSKCLEDLESIFQKKFELSLFQKHKDIPVIIANTHRFRALESGGLYALAKDLARLSADSIKVASLREILKAGKDDSWRSLKGLEKLLETKVGAEKAKTILGPLFGIYDLRLGDAHLAAADIDMSFQLLEIDRSLPTVHQAETMLNKFVTCIYKVGNEIG